MRRQHVDGLWTSASGTPVWIPSVGLNGEVSERLLMGHHMVSRPVLHLCYKEPDQLLEHKSVSHKTTPPFGDILM